METGQIRVAADVMQRDVVTVSPRWSMAELERVLCEHKIGGAPVVDGKELVGVVSRSDLVRQTEAERSRAGQSCDYYRGYDCDPRDEQRTQLAEESFVSNRLTSERVADVMSPPSFVASPDMSIRDVAGLLSRHSVHRVPVVDGGRLVGIISSLDLVDLIASGSLVTLDS